MRKSLLISIIILTYRLAYAQIGEVKMDGNYGKIYDDNGRYTGTSIYIGSGNYLEGYNSKYLIIRESNYAKIYDYKGNYTGNSIYLGSNIIKNVSGSAILIKDGSYVKYYNFQGNYTGNSTYEP